MPVSLGKILVIIEPSGERFAVIAIKFVNMVWLGSGCLVTGTIVATSPDYKIGNQNKDPKVTHQSYVAPDHLDPAKLVRLNRLTPP